MYHNKWLKINALAFGHSKGQPSCDCLIHLDMDCFEIWNGFYEWCLRRNCSLGSTGTLHITQSAG